MKQAPPEVHGRFVNLTFAFRAKCSVRYYTLLSMQTPRSLSRQHPTCRAPTVHCLLSTACCVLPTVYCVLRIAYCLLSRNAPPCRALAVLSAVCCLLSTVYRVLPTVYCLVTARLSRTDCVLCTARYPLCVVNVCGARAADVPRGGYARFGREGAGVQEAHPDVHRTHAGDDVPGGEATEYGAVPGLGESFEFVEAKLACFAWCCLVRGRGFCHGVAGGYSARLLSERWLACAQ